MSIPKIGKITFGKESLDLDLYLGDEYADISQACEELPALIEWLNMHLQAYIQQKIIVKQEIKEAEATAYFDLKNGGFQEKGFGEKITEASLEYAIALDDRVKEKHKELAMYTGWVSRLTNTMAALQLKMDLVRSSEATRRRLLPPTDDRELETQDAG